MNDRKRCIGGRQHLFSSEHVPGHIVYWVKQCSLCHIVDWDDLDEEIKKALNYCVDSLKKVPETIPETLDNYID